MNNMATQIEAKLDSLAYTGETRRWNFEKYVNKYVELYNQAQDLISYGYSGIENALRVRKLLNGIKTDSLDSVRNQILADQVLASDFDRVVNLFKDYIAQKKMVDLNATSIEAACSMIEGSARSMGVEVVA